MNIQDATNILVGSSAASKAYVGSTQVWPHDWSQEYLTIIPRQQGRILIYFPSDVKNYVNSVSYSIDGGSWVTLNAPTTEDYTDVGYSSNGPLVSAGSHIRFKCSCVSSSTPVISTSATGHLYPLDTRNNHIGGISIGFTKPFNLAGNVMSLLYGDNFSNKTSMGAYALQGVFASWDRGVHSSQVISGSSYASQVVDTTNLVLPNGISEYCYANMFNSCLQLTTAMAQLPSTNLAQHCYDSMYYRCTALTKAPNLPVATVTGTVAYYCYSSMFSGCTSLVNGPDVMLEKYYQHSCETMFYGCTSMNNIKLGLVYTPQSTNYTDGMFYNVSSTGTLYMNSNKTWNKNEMTGTYGFPANWTYEYYN